MHLFLVFLKHYQMRAKPQHKINIISHIAVYSSPVFKLRVMQCCCKEKKYAARDERPRFPLIAIIMQMLVFTTISIKHTQKKKRIGKKKPSGSTMSFLQNS